MTSPTNRGQEKDRILLVNKPPGLTSFDIIRQVKKRLAGWKIGHTGTLDKFAGGLLILVTGRYTRLAELFLGLSKEYLALIELGTTTDTLDPEGVVIDRKPLPGSEAIDRVLARFTGEIEQVPPLFSAVHHQGQRAYKLARSGEKPELKARQVHIYCLEKISWNPPELTIRVKCSKGTYIRALARDMGKALDSCAYVKNLIRTSIGSFKLAAALEPEQITEDTEGVPCRTAFSDFTDFTCLTIKREYVTKMLQGGALQEEFFCEDTIPLGSCFVFTEEGRLAALIEKHKTGFQYLCVLEKSGNLNCKL